jgi:hypothetical protein
MATTNNINYGTVTTSGFYRNLITVYSSSGTISNGNQRVSYLANMTGLNPGIPLGNTIPQNTYLPISSYRGLKYNQDNTEYEDLRRFMTSRSTVKSPGNTRIITFAGDYKLLSWEDTNQIRQNSSLLFTTVDEGDTSTAFTCSIGDRITGTKPFSIYYSTGANVRMSLQGAYGGYCGYNFATRNDRDESGASPNRLLMFPLDPDPTETVDENGDSWVRLGYQTTTNPIVSSGGTQLSTVAFDLTGTGYSVNYVNYELDITRNYFATSQVLMCAWRGYAAAGNTKDTVLMFPMTNEAKYGWFSTGGHILAVASTYQRLEGGIYQTTDLINGNGASSAVEMATDNLSGTDVDSQSSWAYTNSAPGNTGGTRFAGRPSVVYQNPGPVNSAFSEENNAGFLFTCEQQADGDGTEMSPFVTEDCMSIYTCNHGGGQYMAFITTFSSNSDQATLLHFNSGRNLIGTYNFGSNANTDTIVYQSVSANVSSYSSVRLDGGAASGISISAGDVFQICSPVGETCVMAAWGDVDATDDDETVFIMGDSMGFTGGSGPQSFQIIGDGGNSGYGSANATLACSPVEEVEITLYRDFVSALPSVGDQFYMASSRLNSASEIDSVRTSGKFYKIVTSRSTYAFSFNDPANGRVATIAACSDKRQKKNIIKINTSPSGINLYQFEYIDEKFGRGKFVGVLAQEVPQAAEEHDGILFVNYDKIDTIHQEWNGPDCTCNQNICYNCHPSN